MDRYVKAEFVGEAENFTPEKAYKIFSEDGCGFFVMDDDGEQYNCVWNGCPFIDMNVWIECDKDGNPL